MLLSRSLWERFVKVLHPEYNSALCLRPQVTACKICMACCPLNALQTDHHSKPPELDCDRCEGCLLCVAACPTGAFSHPKSELNSWTTALSMSIKPLSIACGEVFKYAGPWVACGGSFTYPVLAYLAVLGEGLNIYVADCKTCRWQGGNMLFQKNVSRANQALSLLAENVQVKIIGPAGQPDDIEQNRSNSDRRIFLQAQMGRVKEFCNSAVIELVTGLSSAINTNQAVKIEIAARRWFLQKLQQDPKMLPSYLIPFTSLQKNRVVGEQEARRAALRCVTGAIYIERTTKHFKLFYRPDYCTKCVQGPCPAWPQAPYEILANEVDNKVVLLDLEA